MKVYQQIARGIHAMEYCRRNAMDEMARYWQDVIERTVRDYLPSGSGFDNGTSIDLEESTPEKLVLHTSFHHMLENGEYWGWTDHQVIVTPSLGFMFTMRITGRNRDDIKDYIAQEFFEALIEEVRGLPIEEAARDGQAA
jgi:hypothetical protein